MFSLHREGRNRSKGPPALSRWIERRANIRRRWQADARRLVADDERTAYYEAQRCAARARAEGDTKAYLHWAKVAAEIARISSVASMDIEIVRNVIDAEVMRVHHRGSSDRSRS